MNEQNVFKTFRRKAATISWYFRDAPRIPRHLHVSVKSACQLDHLPNGSVDFVFTDPPFGSNINYSEMNFLWESWLQQHTDNSEEAIISKPQNKTATDYQVLLCRAFLEANRVLRDDGWMCVVFHNSSEKVWNALQRAIIDSGFEVKTAQTFDKQHGTFKMFVSDNAVGYDLVLHCKKRGSSGRSVTELPKASTDSVREFVRQRLAGKAGYQVRYLHVSRESEFDYRRLYAEWLCAAFAKSEISLDFESFRTVVDDVKKEKNA
jgi:adenine-specific DNA methylase